MEFLDQNECMFIELLMYNTTGLTEKLLIYCPTNKGYYCLEFFANVIKLNKEEEIFWVLFTYLLNKKIKLS